jgi:hypothetical protein
MLTPQQEKTLINMIPQDTTGEDRRAAYAVITGIKEDKNANQIASYYSITNELVTKWYDFFALDQESAPSRGRKSRKGKDLTAYVKSNLGKTVTPKMVSDDLGISLPTFYNFYNANRGYFKKVKRGEFEIINPDEQRIISK